MESLETILKPINAVLGVTGSFVCLSDGSITANAMPDKFDAASLDTTARLATQTLYALETSGQRIPEIDLVYSQGRLILKNLRGAILVIVCGRNVNIPLLNLTANSVAKKISAEFKPPKSAAEPARKATTAPPEPTTAASAAAEGTPSPSLEVAAGSTPPPETMDGKFFGELTRELTRVMGPAAGIIIEDEVSALKETRETFPKARTDELVERVSRAIRDETKRAKFQQVMLHEIRKPQ